MCARGSLAFYGIERVELNAGITLVFTPDFVGMRRGGLSDYDAMLGGSSFVDGFKAFWGEKNVFEFSSKF